MYQVFDVERGQPLQFQTKEKRGVERGELRERKFDDVEESQ
jgi:hypothetical protein